MMKRMGMLVLVILFATPATADDLSKQMTFETVAHYLDLKDALNLCEIGKFLIYDDAQRRDQTEFFRVVVRAGQNMGIDVENLLDPRRPVSLEYREREKDLFFVETPGKPSTRPGGDKQSTLNEAEQDATKQTKRAQLQQWCSGLDRQLQALVGGYMIAQASLVFRSPTP
ncbi:hypothetical protein [Afipia sp. 1NLS2]|uniref:hypothetical protein n=1 Tax=Afipia sp. 1NLS2 TaxID=666684 RepID=UPI0001D9E239|nr:hypothetical protein [Afipia sp. 1NLS2]EFI50022.1 hypothetical protein AfiDRAFT_3729 [Afipia sp. 1NLS2]